MQGWESECFSGAGPLTQKEASAKMAKTKKMCGIVPEKVGFINEKVVGKSDVFAS